MRLELADEPFDEDDFTELLLDLATELEENFTKLLLELTTEPEENFTKLLLDFAELLDEDFAKLLLDFTELLDLGISLDENNWVAEFPSPFSVQLGKLSTGPKSAIFPSAFFSPAGAVAESPQAAKNSAKALKRTSNSLINFSRRMESFPLATASISINHPVYDTECKKTHKQNKVFFLLTFFKTPILGIFRGVRGIRP